MSGRSRHSMHAASHITYLRTALSLAKRGYGATSPNPMVGAVLVKQGKIIGRGWHQRAGMPHAEIEALRNAEKRGHSARGATIYVTLEPCCTHGRTPPCTDAIIAAGIKTVAVGATDPNPKHAGKGFKVLQRAGIETLTMDEIDRLQPTATGKTAVQRLARECTQLNEAFNHWIVHRTPLVTVKAAMTLDGKIATASGESKWITGEAARRFGMKLRLGHDAILVGVNTVMADDPALTPRVRGTGKLTQFRRIVLDSLARTPLTAKLLNDEFAANTIIVVTNHAPAKRVAALARKATVWTAPPARSAAAQRKQPSGIHLPWLLKKLGGQNIASLLVEGGGEVNASFLLGGYAQRVAFFYAPKVLGGRDARKGVAGEGAKRLSEIIELDEITWRKLGDDLLLAARVKSDGG